MITLDEITSKFHSDIMEMSIYFIKHFKLLFRETDDINAPIMRWMDFRLRYIEKKPRNVLYSKDFLASVPSECKPKLEILEGKIKRGDDINSFQGKGLTKYHDTSASDYTKRTDVFLAHFGIIHLHISGEMDNGTDYIHYMKRSKWLLFCIIDDETARFISVESHKNRKLFKTQRFLQTCIENWPQYMERFQVKGITGEQLSDEKFEKQLQHGGFNVIFSINEYTFAPPGGGVSGDNSASKVYYQCAVVMNYIQGIAIDIHKLFYSNKAFLDYSRSANHPTLRLFVDYNGFKVYFEEVKALISYNDKIIKDIFAPDWVLQEIDLKI